MSLYFPISAFWHSLCSLLIFAFPPSHSLLVFFSSHSAVNRHPDLHLIFLPSTSFSCWTPSVPESLSFSSFPSSLWFLAGFMASWCMPVLLQTHLSADSSDLPLIWAYAAECNGQNKTERGKGPMKSVAIRSHTVVFEVAGKSKGSGFMSVGLVDQTLPVISY